MLQSGYDGGYQWLPVLQSGRVVTMAVTSQGEERAKQKVERAKRKAVQRDAEAELNQGEAR